MPQPEYFNMLRNAVYSDTKANELTETINILGYNWFNLKEQIKTIRLANAPVV